MRLAIPIWNGRVSPVFDAASRLMLVEVEHGMEVSRQVVEIGADPFPIQRTHRLTDLQVRVLICGAISRPLASFVAAAGIDLIPWVAGPVEEVLRAYLAGRLSESRWRMPGCAGRSNGPRRGRAGQQGPRPGGVCGRRGGGG